MVEKSHAMFKKESVSKVKRCPLQLNIYLKGGTNKYYKNEVVSDLIQSYFYSFDFAN
jgi:hypothetical protein